MSNSTNVSLTTLTEILPTLTAGQRQAIATMDAAEKATLEKILRNQGKAYFLENLNGFLHQLDYVRSL